MCILRFITKPQVAFSVVESIKVDVIYTFARFCIQNKAMHQNLVLSALWPSNGVNYSLISRHNMPSILHQPIVIVIVDNSREAFC
jgi:hypothetical protein